MGMFFFTQYGDPQIKLDFQAPEYREFTCLVKAKDSFFIYNTEYSKELGTSNEFDFSLTSIGDGTNDLLLNDEKVVLLEVDCTDVYNISYSSGIYELHYDTTPPKLVMVLF